MDVNDFVKTRLGFKSKLESALWYKVLRPAGDDACDPRIWLPANEVDCLVTGNTPQGVNLVADTSGKARHGEVAAKTDLLGIKANGMDEETDGGAWACEPMPNAVFNRQDGFLTCQRLADNIGEETRGRFVRFSGTHTDGWQPQADTVKNAFARIVRDQQFCDGLLRSVTGERCQMKFVADFLRERFTVYGER